MVVVRAQWGRVAMFSDPLCLVLPSPFCSDVTGSTGHWPLHSPAPCCTVKGPDVLRNFVLLSWAPFSSSPRDDSFTHWDCGWVWGGGQLCHPPSGALQLVLCQAVPTSSSFSYSSPTQAAEQVRIPQMGPKTSPGALCVLKYISCFSSWVKSKNGRF